MLVNAAELARKNALARSGTAAALPRLLFAIFNYVLLLSNTERMVAAKDGVSLLSHQRKLQPSL